MTRALRWWALWLFAAGCNCRGSQVSHPHGAVTAPSSLDFGTVFVGYPATLPLPLVNTGVTPVDGTLKLDAPFSPPSTALHFQGGASLAPMVTFAPTAVGTFSSSATFDSDEGQHLVVSLSGTSAAVPDCQPSGACVSSAFSPDAGACVESMLPEGTDCSSGAGCLQNATCQSGVCRGTATTACDDHNPCTLDSCDVSGGCQYFDISAQCPRPADRCHVASCDPTSGCGAVEVDDGTLCGPSDCSLAHICLSGACTAVVPNEGSICAPKTPCQGSGACHGNACVRPDAGALQPAWTYASPSGFVDAQFHPIADEAGNLYFRVMERNDAGVFTGYQLSSVDRDGSVRWSVPMPTLVSAPLIDQGVVLYCETLGSCHALSSSSGGAVWAFDPTAVLGSDAGYSYSPVSLGADGVVISAQPQEQGTAGGGAALLDWSTGAVIWSLADLRFSVAALADEAHNIYFVGEPAGELPATNRHLSSVSRSGVFRWMTEPGGVDEYNTPIATYGGRLSVLTIGTNWAIDVSAIDGGVLAELDVSQTINPGPISIFDGLQGWSRAVPSYDAGQPYGDCNDHLGQPGSVASWDFGTGAMTFQHQLGPYGLSIHAEGPELLEHDSVLLIDERSDCGDAGARLVPTLTVIDAAGDETFSCQIPTATKVPDFTGLVPLGAGRWAMVTYDATWYLAAYDLGVDPPAHGWTEGGIPYGLSGAGTAGNAHRPR